MQGLLLLARHDATVLNTVEKTGIFDTMFSSPAKKAAYLLLETAEHVAEFQNSYLSGRRFDKDGVGQLGSMFRSLDSISQLGQSSYPREAFLTAIALSIKVFLGIVLPCRCETAKEETPGDTAIQLLEVFSRPEQQLPSSLALCSSLESLFWQTMMGAIAAPDDRSRGFFRSRMNRITAAMGLTSWHDALFILRRFFWIPSIFSGPGQHIFDEVIQSQGHVDASTG
jgi:hypothetical protein